MSVQCVHWTQGELGNEATSTAYLHFWRLFMSMYSLWMWRMSRKVYPYLLSFKLGTHTILEMYYLLQWHTDHLNCLLGSISPYTQSTCKTKVSLSTRYKHCKLKWEKSMNKNRLNTSPTHFQCTGYLHIQTLIQTPLSDSPIIVSNTVVPCIRLIFNPMP